MDATSEEVYFANLSHMTILTPPGFEINEIYSMYTKEEPCSRRMH